jgi:hypothetical protein
MAWPLTWVKGLFKPEAPDAVIDAPEVGKNETSNPKRPAVMLISIIGLGEAERDNMLDWMVEDCAASGKVPVFIVDDLDLAPWLSRELVVEHLPSMKRQRKVAPDLDWDLYLKRRLDFLKRKWSVEHIVDLGRSLDQLTGTSLGATIDVEPARQAIGSH